MRPSNYNYLKRMWTREYCKNGGCLTNIILFPFKIIAYPFLWLLKGLFHILKTSNKKEDYFKKLHQDAQRTQMLSACSYGSDLPEDYIFYSDEYQAFTILSECEPKIGALQYCMKITMSEAMSILERLEKLGALKIEESYSIKLLMTKEELVEKLK